jgi:hypothetical protein
MVVVNSICHFSVEKLVRKYLKLCQNVHSAILNIIDQTQHYKVRVTPSYWVDEWLP